MSNSVFVVLLGILRFGGSRGVFEMDEIFNCRQKRFKSATLPSKFVSSYIPDTKHKHSNILFHTYSDWGLIMVWLQKLITLWYTTSYWVIQDKIGLLDFASFISYLFSSIIKFLSKEWIRKLKKRMFRFVGKSFFLLYACTTTYGMPKYSGQSLSFPKKKFHIEGQCRTEIH